jgi:putative addiction module component (TIGR02574 family)
VRPQFGGGDGHSRLKSYNDRLERDLRSARCAHRPRPLSLDVSCAEKPQRRWEPERTCLDAFLDNGRREGYYPAMSKTTDDILNNAMRLSTTERAELAAALLASLDGETEDAVEAAWAAEIQRRVERVRSGEAKGRPWSEVRERLEQRRK